MVAIIAHGGARSLAPENTLAAARKAHALGADLWETDVAITADGQLVLMHDDAMMRTTDVADRFPDRVPAPFSTYTLAEIRTLDAGLVVRARRPLRAGRRRRGHGRRSWPRTAARRSPRCARPSS